MYLLDLTRGTLPLSGGFRRGSIIENRDAPARPKHLGISMGGRKILATHEWNSEMRVYNKLRKPKEIEIKDSVIPLFSGLRKIALTKRRKK